MTLGRVRLIITAVEKQHVLNIMCGRACARVCSLSYAACNAHAPYVSLYRVFPHYLTNGTIFGKTLLNIYNMCVDFLYNFLPETFLILRRIKLDIIKVRSLHVKYPLFLSDFNETRIF